MSIEIHMKNQEDDIDDENIDDCITEESSPNSIKNYTFSVANKDNVLLLNKGQVKDKEKFKQEIIRLLFEKQQTVRKATNPPKQKLNIFQARVFNSCVKKDMNINLQIENDDILNQVNKLGSHCAGEAESNEMKLIEKRKFQTTRSVSRKVSSRKILHLLQMNLHEEEKESTEKNKINN